ncbi:MAG: response regulator [Candidatus Moraniibacteriota bacterium]
MLSQINVLFIEDDPDQLFLFGKSFELTNVLTQPATTEEEVFRFLSLLDYDIVLLDVMLRHENGLDIMEKLKKDKRAKDLPFFVFTNTDKKEFRDRAEKLGANAYIIKSETLPQEMAARIRKFVEERRAKKNAQK